MKVLIYTQSNYHYDSQKKRKKKIIITTIYAPPKGATRSSIQPFFGIIDNAANEQCNDN